MAVSTMRKRLQALVPPAVFGGIDGLGLAIGLLLVVGGKGLVVAAIANAASEFAGMGAGEWLSRRGESLRIPVALVNGGAAAVGALLPIIAYSLGGTVAAILTLVASVVVIAWSTPSKPWWRSWLETFGTVAFVAGVTFGVSLLI